jgi:hypothetical protein
MISGFRLRGGWLSMVDALELSIRNFSLVGRYLFLRCAFAIELCLCPFFHCESSFPWPVRNSFMEEQ